MIKNFTIRFVPILLSVFVMSVPAALAGSVLTHELPDLIDQVSPEVVNISTTTVIKQTVYGMDEYMRFWGVPQERKHTSLGSGFILDKDGFIFTNNHVVDHATEVLITLFDKRQFLARVVGKDQKLDLALLQIRDKDRKIPDDLVPVKMGNSDGVRIGQPVFAVGNPFGFQHSVHAGIISGKNRTIGQGPFDNFLQTDAAINPGNSGGPLFDFKGEVIGINTLIYSRTGQSSGLGFAIPVNEAKAVLADLKRYGRVPRPWLGVLSERMSRQLQMRYNLGASEGVLIFKLVNRGPAQRAGIEAGDIIESVDGAQTLEPYDVERALAKRRPGEPVKLKIRRGTRLIESEFKLEELPRLDNLPQGII